MLLEDGSTRVWTNHGRILSPDPGRPWLASCAGASGACVEQQGGQVRVFVAGRDEQNRSLIGCIRLDLAGETPRVAQIDDEPVLRLGTLGTFDENGVSYPCPVQTDDGLFLYYVGWMPTVLTPFQNHVGLAVDRGQGFVRASRAPILPRIDAEPLCTGSAYVMLDEGRWRMWYTAFLAWGEGEGEALHRYLIRYAESEDGIHWRRDGVEAVGFKNEAEYCVARPSVLKWRGRYHMWFTHRGEEYALGYAWSEDGKHWLRCDDKVGFTGTGDPWDDRAQCYPAVFRAGGRLYMLYCGNDYGRGGLGLASLEL